MKTDRLDHISLKIPEDSIDKSLGFYRDLLGLEPWKLEEYRNGERTSFFLKKDNFALNIRPSDDVKRPSRTGIDHFCIQIGENIEEIE